MNDQSKVKLWDSTVGKVIKTALYMAASAAVGSITAAIANDPDLFGPVTALVNLCLVFLKQLLDPNTPNIPR